MTQQPTTAHLEAEVRDAGMDPALVPLEPVADVLSQILTAFATFRERFGDLEPDSGGFDD